MSASYVHIATRIIKIESSNKAIDNPKMHPQVEKTTPEMNNSLQTTYAEYSRKHALSDKNGGLRWIMAPRALKTCSRTAVDTASLT
ncbi:hypothetical protein CPC08DRAFT_708783 [Agrocybe pediades]|nr:hypothetical protein CPC08DRAFT_708783 [Agrocybe pediades]